MYKLLIVDDEPLIRQGIRQLLDYEALSIGEVFEASDGAEALSLVVEKHPHIVLADINMPHMDGLSLAGSIKKIDRDIRIALITGYDYFDYAVTALKTGVDDYLLKPVSRSDIQELLRKLVAKIREEEAQRSAMQAIEHLQRLARPDGNDATNVAYRDKILTILDQSASDPAFSLSKLAQKINLSPGYLSPLFKQIFGIPFQDYLTTMRLERSKILLLSTGRKIYEIAGDVGFDDPNYFSTSFKKHFGMSPNQFREEATRGPT